MGSEQTVVPDHFLRKGVTHTTIVKVGVAFTAYPKSYPLLKSQLHMLASMGLNLS